MSVTGAFADARWQVTQAALAERLAARVHRSALRSRALRTVRREDHRWQLHRGSLGHCELSAGAVARVELWRLPDRATLPWPREATAQEVLVIDGALVSRDALGAEIVVPRHGLALRSPVEGTVPALQAHAAAFVYVRSLLVELDRLPAIEAAWWSLPRASLQAIDPACRRWHASFSGVQVLPLWGSPACASMLVRFAPGADVPDHGHAIDEDCLMLAGEMFLGDVLLRPGDYQLAPAGVAHVGECSDVGGLFFFHGALDAALDPQRGAA